MSKYDVILDVYENQSISKAAQKHNYTQSAVSQTIRNYEKEIGLKLFKRSKNGMEALPGTEPIFEELMHIRSANTRIDQIVSNINNLDSGFIRIGTVQSIAYNWLPGVLKNFSAEYPNITFLSSGFEIFFEKSPKRIVVRKVNQATSASCKAIASLAIRAFTSSSCVCFAFSAGIALTTKIVPPILSTKPVFISSTVITSLRKNRGVRFRTPRYQPKKDYSFS